MTRFTKLPTQALAIGLFAIVGLAAANPMADFVDCSDSFWAVACGTDGDSKTEIILGEPVQIDNDATCVEIENDMLFCHS